MRTRGTKSVRPCGEATVSVKASKVVGEEGWGENWRTRFYGFLVLLNEWYRLYGQIGLSMINYFVICLLLYLTESVGATGPTNTGVGTFLSASVPRKCTFPRERKRERSDEWSEGGISCTFCLIRQRAWLDYRLVHCSGLTCQKPAALLTLKRFEFFFFFLRKTIFS